MADKHKIGSGAAANTRQARLAREHQERKDRFDAQIADGSLVIRQMTDQERAYWAARRPTVTKGGRRKVSRAYYIDDERSSVRESSMMSLHGARLA